MISNKRGEELERFFNEYRISNDKSLLSLASIQGLLTKSYWANQRSREVIEKSIENSICFGIYSRTDQVGFARVVTDYATMYWVADVIIDEAHRGKGLGKELIRSITEMEALRCLQGILFTSDAHGLYEQFGFMRVPDKAMVRRLRSE